MPISRCDTTACLLLYMYSIGSSIVRMWHWRRMLMWSMSDASVVDLPAPVGPVSEDEPDWFLGELGGDGGEAEVLERRDGERDDPERDRSRASLHVRIASDTGMLLPGEREVDLQVLDEDVVELRREHPLDDHLALVTGEHPLVQRLVDAVDPGEGRRVRRQQEIGAA